jgi:hypothetical protein
LVTGACHHRPTERINAARREKKFVSKPFDLVEIRQDSQHAGSATAYKEL